MSSEDSYQRDLGVSEDTTAQKIASQHRKSAGLASYPSRKDDKIAVDSTSAVQEDFDMRPRQLVLGADTHQYDAEELQSQFPGRKKIVSGPEIHAKACPYDYSDGGPGLNDDATTKKSPSIMEKIMSTILSGLISSPAKSNFQRRSSHVEQSRQHLRLIDGMDNQISKENLDEIVELKKTLKMLQSRENEWTAKEMHLNRQIERIQSKYSQVHDELEHQTGVLRNCQADVRQINSEKQLIQEQYNSFLRKQQEESFPQMTSARWLPVEESKVIGDLDRLKREMRRWAKAASIDSIPQFQSLERMQSEALLKELAEVVVLENNQLSQGLSTPKSSALLLNALLAHSVYASLFRMPFSFLEDGFDGFLSAPGVNSMLSDVYFWALESNKEDANIWRSQMMRLLLPPLRDDSSQEEMDLRSKTEGLIADVACKHASNFLEGAARHLISEEAQTKCSDELQAIYQDAGTLFYMLWTRRTGMRCYTLQDHYGSFDPNFDPDSKVFVPHTSVKYDDHEDELRGRPISLIVHPLLMAYGTDDGKDYDQGRIWASAEVWLDI